MSLITTAAPASRPARFLVIPLLHRGSRLIWVANRAAFNLAQFVKAGALPEDCTRAQLEAHAAAAGLSILEARRTIDSAFHAAEPRSLPS